MRYRWMSLVPAIPAAIAIYIGCFMPPPRFALGEYQDVLVYLQLRTELFFVLFYIACLSTLVIVIVAPSRLTAAVGAVCDAILLNIVFLWTAQGPTPYNLLPYDDAGIASVSRSAAYGAICVALALAATLAVAERQNVFRAIFRFLQGISLAVLPLGVDIYFFDRSDFFLHVTNVGLTWITNYDLLIGATMVLGLSLTGEVTYELFWKRRSRSGRDEGKVIDKGVERGDGSPLIPLLDVLATVTGET